MFDLLISSAHAQATAAAPQQNPIMSMIPLVAVFFVFYFLMIRPQKKKMADEQEFISGLEKGSEIYTKSGILGKITGLTDKVATIEIEGGVKLKILRTHIAGSAKDIFEVKETPVKK